MLEGGEILGPYRIGEVLGEGGFAWVYAGEHTALGHRVAIKVLLPHLVAKDSVRGRFLDEARLQANLQHPHIVRVHDILAEPGVAAMVLEHADGGALDELLDARGALPSDDVRRIGSQLLDALGFAHQHGVIHRDVKPSNVLLRGGDGLHCLLTDFGIARVRGELRGRKASTAGGATLGTIAYASPEQLADPRSVDARSDVWSAGVLLLEAATGEHPFDDGSDYGTMKAIAEATPSIPAALRRRDPALVAALDGALRRDPDKRWPDASAFAEALAKTEAPRSTSPKPAPKPAKPAPRPAKPPPNPARPPKPPPVHVAPPPKSGRPWLAVLGLLALAALAGGGLLMVGESAPPPPPKAVAPVLPGALAFPASGASDALIVATGNSYLPYYDHTGSTPRGSDVLLARELATRLGKTRVDFRPGKGVRARVAAGSADVGIAAISITPTRAKETLFSLPYEETSFRAVGTRSLRPGDMMGASCSVWKDHALYTGLLKKSGCALQLAESHADALDMVRRGRVDVTVLDAPAARRVEPPLKELAIHLGEDRLGIALQLGNGELKGAVDAALQDMKRDGTLRRLRWSARDRSEQ